MNTISGAAIPSGQYLTRREVLLRLQRAFKANGMEFARRSVSVRGDAEVAAAAVDDICDGTDMPENHPLGDDHSRFGKTDETNARAGTNSVI